MRTKRAYANVAAYLAATGTTQDAFARRLGITAGYLSLILDGHRRPRLTLALRIASEANVPIESLILPPKERAS